MIGNASFAFLHFAAVLGLTAALFIEWVTLTPTPTVEAARRLQMCDRWYGISAGLVLVVGVLRVVYFEKGWAFYSASPFFYVKMGLFLSMGLISIYPTTRFIRWGAMTKQGRAPVLSEGEYKRLALTLRAQLVLLFGTALAASLMARGVGI